MGKPLDNMIFLLTGDFVEVVEVEEKYDVHRLTYRGEKGEAWVDERWEGDTLIFTVTNPETCATVGEVRVTKGRVDAAYVDGDAMFVDN